LSAIAVDSSAIIAILRVEPEERRFMDAIIETDAACISAVSLQESSMVLAGQRGSAAVWQPLDALIRQLALEIVPHDAELARIARDAFLRFGKGRHPAALNCGACASYALAKARGVPLLFKGRDFAQTDIPTALGHPS
jgi:ribonuclease VapC